jgi:hypothetical protein
MTASQLLLLGGASAPAVDPYFYSVTSLLHGDGTNGAQNNTFLDSSTNNFTITRNGNTTQGSFSPFSQTGWSNYFNGSTDYFYWQQPGSTYPNQLSFLNGASAVGTIEAWVYVNSVAQGANVYDVPPIIAVGDTYFSLSVTSANKLRFYWFTGVANSFDSTTIVPFNSWTHVAAVRNGATVTLYVNGVASGSAAYTGWSWASGSAGTLMIVGVTSPGGTSRFFNGYISNLRVINGTAQYTSNFTPPTSPLTAVTNTSLLTCQSNRFSDNSTNNITWTVIGGTPSIQPFSPFNPTTAYSTSAVGGSGYFDGSGDVLNVARNSAFDFGSGSLTLEAWVYITAYPPVFGTILGQPQTNGTAGNTVVLGVSPAGAGQFYAAQSSGGYAVALAAGTIPRNTWTHLAGVRNGNVFTLYINGTSVGSTTQAITLTQDAAAGGMEIGGSLYFSNYYSTGYICDARVVKGTAVYTANFTPPTAPLTAITNTSLLTNFTNAGIFDNAADADYETVGNAQISTSVKKYGTGSISFDGSGDYIVAAPMQTLAPGTGDFCYEFWLYANSSSNACIFDTRAVNNNTTGFACLLNGSSQIALYTNSTILTCSAVLSASVWYHVAVTRTAGVIKVFLNGTQIGSLANTSNFSDKAFRVGQYVDGTGSLNGYVDDLRISNGIGRYPYNFTPPTAEFPNIGGTVTLTADPYFDYTTLLLPGNGTNGAQNNTFLDSSTNNFTITRNGNTTQGTFSPFSQTGWGNFFDGTGDYLTIANNVALQPGGGAFTYEAWVYCLSYPSAGNFETLWAQRATSSGYGGPLVVFNSSGTLLYYISNAAATNWQITGSSSGLTLSLNQWNHVAIVRNVNTCTIYLNGTAGTSVTLTENVGVGGNLSLMAGAADGTQAVDGYMSNFRLVKGTAVYTANFTPPTAPLTAITNTSLLTCQSNRFVDNSSNAFAITRNGDVSVQAFSPFNPTAAWSAATNGGSGYFDGSGDYLSIANNSAFNLGTNNFCIEGWFYPTTSNATQLVFNKWGTVSDTQSMFQIGRISSTFYAQLKTTGGFVTLSTATWIPNAWNHFAVVRNGSTISAYLNGSRFGTDTSNPTLNSGTETMTIGSKQAQDYFTGYITDCRIVNGSAIYDPTQTSITVPTAPLTAVTNTAFLSANTNAGIYDATSKNDLETVGNAQISTTQSKFGGSSMLFDGTGDYLSIPATQNIVFGTADFTIEMWVYSGSQGSTGVRMFGNGAGAAWSSGKYILTTTTAANPNKFTLGINNASPADVLVSTTTFNDSTWKHVAITRYNGVFRLFVNGILESTNTTNVSVDNGTAAQIRIGSSGISGDADWAGYIDDLRITKGIARYTSNFTPPTTAFLTL